MKTTFNTLLFIFPISLMLLACPLYSIAGEYTSTQTKDIQIINPYEFGDYYYGERANEYKKIMVSIEDIKVRLLKSKPVHFVEKQEEEKRTIKAEWITDVLKKKYGVKKIYFKNAIITGDLDLHIKDNLVNIDKSGMEVDEIKKQKNSGIEKVFLISPSIYIENCKLQGNLKVGRSNHDKNIIIFKKPVAFSNSTVEKDANFIGTIFNSEAYFIGTIFNGEANIGSASFNDEAVFNIASFKEKANFDSVSFKKKTNFMYASFKEKTNFWNARFNGEAKFMNVIFNNEANFRVSRFKKNVCFIEAGFNGEAEFKLARFIGEADFTLASFNNEVNFESASFYDVTKFESAIFNNEVNFESASFYNVANFRTAIFNGETNFESAIFNSEANFGSAYFY